MKNFNLYESEKMKEVRAEHPDWIWNRGDTHVVLGVPGSLEAFKTPVDPGNSFSPGPGTYGVSSWVYADGSLHAPETMPLETIRWRFEDGYLPVLHSVWQAGPIGVHSELFTVGDNEISDYFDYFRVELTNTSAAPVEARFFLVIRSFGAAGGELRKLGSDCSRVFMGGAPLLYADKKADGFGAVSRAATGEDVSVHLKKGELPADAEVDDESTWASGALLYKLYLSPGETLSLDFLCHLHAGHYLRKWIKPPSLPFDFDTAKAELLEQWRQQLSIGLKLPDARYQEALLSQLTHLYMFTVDNSIRITPVSYPIWWLRDGAYVLTALDRGGLHDFADRSCREVASKDAFGGFGSEGDGPSDGIWILSEHYLLTGDRHFLRSVFPDIQRKAALLMKMRRSDKAVLKYTEFVIPKLMLDPNTNLMCLPSRDNLINGRMDHGEPIFWINGFAHLAMKRAALCARALGEDDAPYEAEARGIEEAMRAIAEKEFGNNDRDVNSAFWPAGWAKREDALLRERYLEYWDRVRCPGGVHVPEPDWTYFEAGQAHNYMLLGERDKAWLSIEWFLSHHTAPGLYTYPEGIDGNTALLWPRTRGWDDVHFVTPHGWTGAEVFHLLRDGLVYERENQLVIGMGLPDAWKDTPFEVTNLPTYFGRVSFKYQPRERLLLVTTEQACELVSELPFPVHIRRVSAL